jgi:hypothetical protein
VDGPRAQCSSRVLCVLARLGFRSVLVSGFDWKWFRTVRVLPADGPLFGVVSRGFVFFFG